MGFLGTALVGKKGCICDGYHPLSKQAGYIIIVKQRPAYVKKKCVWIIEEVEGDTGASIMASPTEGFDDGNDTVSRHGLGGESCPIDTLGYNAE